MRSIILCLLTVVANSVFAESGWFWVTPFTQFFIPGSGATEPKVDCPHDEREWIYFAVPSLESWAYITVLDPDAPKLVMSPQMALNNRDPRARYVRNNNPCKNLELLNCSDSTIWVSFNSQLNQSTAELWPSKTTPLLTRKTSQAEDPEMACPSETTTSKHTKAPLKLLIPSQKDQFLPADKSPILADQECPFKREFNAFRRKRNDQQPFSQRPDIVLPTNSTEKYGVL